MQICTIWITRTYSSSPELVEAWSEYDIEANYEGWETAREAALQAIGTELAEYRVIDLQVSYEDIENAFDPPQVEAAVLPDERNAD